MAVGSNNTASLQTADTIRCHPIHYNESRHDDVVVDELKWENEYDEHGHRYALLALPKPVPMVGMSKRWERPILQVSLVDDHDCTTATPFQKAWNEAHTLLRANYCCNGRAKLV